MIDFEQIFSEWINIFKVIDKDNNIIFIGKTNNVNLIKSKLKLRIKKMSKDDFVKLKIEIIDKTTNEKLADEWLKYWTKLYTDWGYNLLKIKFETRKNDKLKETKDRKKRNTIMIYEYDINGLFVNEWNSAKDVSLSLNTTDSVIHSYAKQNKLYRNKYVFSFNKYDVLPYKPELPTSKLKPIVQYDLNGNFIDEFNSIKEAVGKIGISASMISSILKGHNKMPRFLFKYKN